MADVAVLVARAMRRLQLLDIAEQPSQDEMTHCVDIMEELIDSWTSQGVYTPTFTLLGDVTANDLRVHNVKIATGISGVNSTANVMIGQNVSGTGIATGARVGSVVTDTMFELDTPATASGSAVTLTFNFLPMPVALEGPLVAVLASRLSEDFGVPLSPKLQMDASDGWDRIVSAYMPDRKTVFDRAIARPPGAWSSNGDWIAS